SHSRPHKSYARSPIAAFDHFEKSVKQVLKASSFWNENNNTHPASVSLADARYLPLKDNSVDMVITSPPYLNAIDYIRGHKFSLVWMGFKINNLRDIRSTNIGTETSKINKCDVNTEHVLNQMCRSKKLSNREARILLQYIHDMKRILLEVNRVLRVDGKAVFV